MTELIRSRSFGEDYRLTPVDRFGIWLSARQVRRWVPDLAGLSVADIGCGFEARLARSLAPRAAKMVVVDVKLAPDLSTERGIEALEGVLPDTLAKIPDSSLDVVLCLSVLEHLWEPEEALDHFRRVLKPSGICLINVPSWMGKRFLEFSAFRLGLSPASEMDDHKTYYDPKDLWPMLVKAGFRPSRIRCFKHKFGLNTFAVCGGA